MNELPIGGNFYAPVTLVAIDRAQRRGPSMGGEYWYVDPMPTRMVPA